MNNALLHLPLKAVKLLPSLLGVTSLGLLLSPPAWAALPRANSTQSAQVLLLAQGDQETGPETLSPQVMKILCQNFPLNSRCTGANAAPESLQPSDNPPATPGAAGEGGIETPPAPSADSPTWSVPTTPSTDATPDETEVPDPSVAPTEDTETPDTDATGGADTPEVSEPDAVAPDPDAAAPEPDAAEDPDAADSEPTGGAELQPVTPDSSPQSEAPSTQPNVQVDAPHVTPSQPSSGADALSPQSVTPSAPNIAQAPESPSPDAAPTVSDQELRQFASAVPELRAVVQKEQQEIGATIDKSELGRARFSELHQGAQSPDNAEATAATPKEKETYQQVIAKIQNIQRESRTSQEQIIQKAGIAPDRFAQILAAIKQDPALQTKVEQMIEN